MAEDEIGGISAEITGDASPLFAVLQRTEAALRQFNAQFGHIQVQISAAIPTQQVLTEARQKITQGFAAAGRIELPVALVLPSGAQTEQFRQQVGRYAATVQPTVQPVIQPPVQQTPEIQRPAPAVAVAAQVDPRNEALAKANASGQRVQYRTPSGGLATVYPTVSRGGPAGTERLSAGGGEFPIGGGPVGLAGTVGPGGENLPQVLEDLARTKRELAQLKEQQQPGTTLTQAQLQQRRAAGRTSYQQAVAEGRISPTGQFLPRGTVQPEITRAPVVIPTAAEITRVAAADQERVELVAGLAAAYGVSPTTFLGAPIEQLRKQSATLQQVTSEGQAAGPPIPISQTSQFQAAVERVRAQQQRQAEAATPTRRLLPEERAQLEQINPQLQQAETVRQQLAGAQFTAAQGQATSPRIAFARLFGRALGAEDINQLRRQAAEAQTELNRQDKAAEEATQRVQVAQGKLNEEIGKGTSDLGPYSRALDSANAAQTRANEGLKEASARATTAATALESAQTTTRGFAASFAGGIVGSLALGVGMQAVTGAVSLFDKAVGPVIERLTGYQNVTARLTDSLSDQTRQQHGLVDIVVSQAEAQANLNTQTAASIQPALAQRSLIEASNKALSDQLDLVNANLAIRQQNAQFGGLDKGLFQTTGGLNILGLQTPFFGTPSTQELIGRQLGQIQGPNIPVATGFGGTVGSLAQQAAGILSPSFGLARSITTPPTSTADQQRVTADSLKYLNEQARTGGETLVKFSEATGTAADQTKAFQQADLLRQAGAGDIADQLERLGGRVVLQNLTDVDAARRFVQAIQTSAQRPDPALVTTQLREQIIPARLFQINAQGDLQRQLIQLQAGVQRAAQPFLPLGATVPGGLGAVSPALRGALGTAQKIDQLNVERVQAARFEIAQITSGLGPQAQAGALAAFGQVQGLGQQALSIQAAITQEQVNFQVAQFNEQLRIAHRSETDLLQITGRIGQVQGDNLGLLQRQVILDQRRSQELTLQSQQLQLQSQELQLQLAQRQINFQVAVAGFTAPGITGEERAARIEEAKKEAEFAQKQLDIQKQQFQIAQQQTQIAARVIPIEFKIQDIGFERQLTDVQHQIALINQGIQVTIDTAAAQEEIQRINAEIDVQTAKLQTYIQGAEQLATAAIADIASQLGTYEGKAEDFFSAVGGAYQEQFTAYMTSVIANVQRGLDAIAGATISAGGQYDPANPPPKATGAQTGYLGTVSTPTRFTVGEAGAETIAVLRNPREMVAYGGGGSSQINISIIINNPTVRSKDDIDALAAMVADKVEQRMSRRTTLLGFRP